MTLCRNSLWLVLFTIFLMSSSVALADFTGETCFADGGQDRAICVAMIGAVRSSAASGKGADLSCPASAANDMTASYAAIDWIRSHPQRKDEDLGILIEEGLMEVAHCTLSASD
jgi:hypothetical protein